MTRVDVFVKYYENASSVPTPDQLSEALRARVVESSAAYSHRLAEIHRSIAVFGTHCRVHHVLEAGLTGNRVVLDVDDEGVLKRGLTGRWLFDGLVL